MNHKAESGEKTNRISVDLINQRKAPQPSNVHEVEGVIKVLNTAGDKEE